MTSRAQVSFEPSSAKVFVDLGLPDAEENRTKLVLALRLNERIKDLGLKQAEIAKRLGIAQPNGSALINYRLDNFSSEKLIEFFNSLGYYVAVVDLVSGFDPTRTSSDLNSQPFVQPPRSGEPQWITVNLMPT